MAAYNIKAALRAAKNIQYEPIEVKVREATNNDPWGVSTSAMSDIARATHHHDEYALLFKMVWKRLNDHEHVMHVQKALILIDYLLRNGADRFLTDAKRRARDISALQKYKQYDANNRDVGGDVRSKAKAVYELLTNEAKLTEERSKAKTIRDVKSSGMGSDGFGSGRSSHAGNAREFDEDRYNAESPRANDWEKDASPAPVKRKEPRVQAEAEDDDEEEEEEKEQPTGDEEIKKKKKKSKSAAAEGAEEGEKKKKKKKKRAAESADTTAPPSAETTAPGTPSFNATPVPAGDFGSFDAFGSNDFGSSVTASAVASPAAPVSTITMSGPTAADKPKKSRKKKDSTIASEPVQQQQQQQQSSGLSVNANGDFDLSNFASAPTPRGEVDMLTGMHSSAPLEDMFAQSSLMDGPMDGPAEEDGFAMDEPALLDQHYEAHVSPRANGMNVPTSPINKDVWDLASNFTNIDNIQSSAPAKPKAANPQDTVSMSMMRSMQPFGSSTVSAAPKPAQPSGFGAFGAPAGGMNGFGAPMQQQQQFGGQQAFGGFGMPQQQMQQGFGAPGGFGGPQQGFPQQQQPFGGMQSGFGGPAFGAPQMPMESDLPFAAQSMNQKRPGANGKPVIFDVQSARPQPTMQQATSNAPTGPRWR